jgi:hypothetical protein
MRMAMADPSATHDSGVSLLASQTVALRRLMPPIDAFGVGGSYGRGTADASADVDFFVIVPGETFWEHVRAFPSAIEHPLPVISRGVGRFMSDYGYRLGFILEGNRKVEYFFNSPETMTPLPLSARIQVLEDRSGWLTDVLARSRARFEADRREHVAAGVHDCLSEIHDLRKHASRGDMLSMIWRLNTLRRHVLALDHIRTSNDVYAPSSAVSRMRAIHDDDTLVSRIDASVPTNDPASIAAAFRALRTLMLEAWVYFASAGVPTREQRRAERELSEEIFALLDRQIRRAG